MGRVSEPPAGGHGGRPWRVWRGPKVTPSGRPVRVPYPTGAPASATFAA